MSWISSVCICVLCFGFCLNDQIWILMIHCPFLFPLIPPSGSRHLVLQAASIRNMGATSWFLLPYFLPLISLLNISRTCPCFLSLLPQPWHTRPFPGRLLLCPWLIRPPRLSSPGCQAIPARTLSHDTPLLNSQWPNPESRAIRLFSSTNTAGSKCTEEQLLLIQQDLKPHQPNVLGGACADPAHQLKDVSGPIREIWKLVENYMIFGVTVNF